MRRAATPLKVAMLLRRQGADLIAIDGSFGVGKSTLARALASRLQVKAVHLDDFLIRRRGAYLKNLRLMQLTKCIGRGRRLILEGICVLQVLELVGRKPDSLVYVKRMTSSARPKDGGSPEFVDNTWRSLRNEDRCCSRGRLGTSSS